MNTYTYMKPTATTKEKQTTTKEKYDNNGKDWYFQFDDDDNKMLYKYILSIA